MGGRRNDNYIIIVSTPQSRQFLSGQNSSMAPPPVDTWSMYSAILLWRRAAMVLRPPRQTLGLWSARQSTAPWPSCRDCTAAVQNANGPFQIRVWAFSPALTRSESFPAQYHKSPKARQQIARLGRHRQMMKITSAFFCPNNQIQRQ